MKMKLGKKGVFDQLSSLGIGLVSMVILFAVVFLILATLKANTTIAAEPNATLAVNTLTATAATIPGWVPIVVIVVIGALLIGLVSYFRGKKQ